MQRLFDVGKVGLFLDGYAPSVEKRKGEEVKILTLTLRVQPFDAKFATAIDDGLRNDAGVKAALFNLSTAEPKPHLRRVDFMLACPRQRMVIFATPDSDSRIAFDQVKIAGTYARTQKDMDGYAFTFKASFGPVDRSEQEYIHEWLLGQRFVTFEEAEPSLAFEDEQAVTDDGPDGGGRPAPMWDDSDEYNQEQETAAAVDTRTSDDQAVRHTPKRGSTKRKKVDHDGERHAQKAEGVKLAKGAKTKRAKAS